MKIVQINSVCGYGSTGKIATDIHNLILSQGHESKIAYGRKGAFTIKDFFTKKTQQNIGEKTFYRIGNDFSVYYHLGLSILTDKAGFYSTKATKELIRWLEEYQPDIIHLHNIHGYYLNIKLLFEYLKKQNIKTIWTLHDCWTFTGHCSYFEFINCNKWKTECNNCPQRTSYPPSICDNSKNNFLKKRELFTGIKDLTIITPSHWLENLVNESFLKNYAVKTIHNGIDLNSFKPTEAKKITTKIMLLGVASIWDKKKGFDDFIQLSKIISDDYQIVLVGLTEKQVKKLPNNIMGITRTNNIKELAELYTMADIFVNPTYEEVLGLVNIEALACGTPVITYNTGGSPECIDETCGIVVEKYNIQALKEAIDYVSNEKPFTVANCINRSKEFDKNKKFMEYLELYTN